MTGIAPKPDICHVVLSYFGFAVYVAELDWELTIFTDIIILEGRIKPFRYIVVG